MKKTNQSRSLSEILEKRNQDFLHYLASILMWQEKMSPKMQKFLFLASQTQMLLIILASQFNLVNDFELDSLGSFLQDFSTALSLLPSSDSGPNGLLLSALFIFFILYFTTFIVTIIALIFYYIKKGRVIWLENMYVYFAEVHYQVVFWIANMGLMSILTIKNHSIAIGSFSINTQNPGFIFVTVIILILNYLIGAFSAYFRFDPFKTENLFSCWNPICQLSGFVFKAIGCLILVWIPNGKGQAIVFFLMTLLVSANLAHKLLTIYPFFYFAAMSYGILFTTSSLLMSVLSTCFLIFFSNSNLSSENLIYMELIMIPLAYAGQYSYLQNMVGWCISENIDKMKTAKEVFRNFFGLAHVMQKGTFTLSAGVLRIENVDELYVMSILRRHTKKCGTPSCICRYMLCRKKKSMPNFDEIKQRYSELSFELIYDLFCGAAKKVSDNIWVQLNLAYLEINRNDCGRNALLTLFEIPKEKTSFQQSVALKKLLLQVKEKIDHFYELQENGVLNIKQFVDYQQTTNHLKELVARNTDDYLKFWTYFKETELSSKLLFDQSKEIESKSEEIEQIWTKFTNLHPRFSFASYPFYASYLAFTRNSVTKAEKLMAEYKKSLQYHFLFENQLVTQENVHDAKNVVVYVSMKEDNLGTVLETSSQIETLGYSATEIIGKNINILMPGAYQTHHQRALRDHLFSRATQSKINENMRILVRSKNGNIMPYNLYIAICPAFESEVIYIGVMRPIFTESDFILLTPEGQIDSFSRRLIAKMGYQSNSLKSLGELFKNSDQVTSAVKAIFGKAGSTSNTSAGKIKNFTRNDFSQQKARSINSEERKIPDSVHFTLIPKESFSKSHTGILTIQTIAENLIPILEITHLATSEVQHSQRPVSSNIEQELNKEKAQSDTLSEIPEEGNNDKKLLKQGENPNKLLPLIQLDSDNKNETDTKTVSDDFEKHVVQAKGESSMHSSTASRRSLQRKIEGAVFYLPRIWIIIGLKIAIALFITEITTILAVYLVEASNQYSMASKDIDLMLDMTNQIKDMISICVTTRQLLILQEGLTIPLSGMTYNQEQNLLISELYKNGQELGSLNSEIRISLGGVDPSFYSQLYDRSISLLDTGTHILIKENAFDYTTSISSSIDRLVADQREISISNTDVVFILDNTFNSYLDSADLIAQIMVLDATSKLNSVGNIILIGVIICVISISFIAMLFLKYQLKFIKEREKFLDALIRVDEKIIEDHLKLVSHLNMGTKKSLTNRSTTAKSTLSTNFTNLKINSVKGGVAKSKGRQRKSISQSGVNINLFYQFLALIGTLFFYLTVFIVLYLLFGSSSSISTLSGKINSALYVGTSYVNLKILYGSLPEYISMNETTQIRNTPITQEWITLYNDATIFQTNLINLLGNVESSTEPALLSNVLEGNLCDLFSGNLSGVECYSVMGGMMLRGVLGLNSELIATSKAVIDQFDQSNRTIYDMKAALRTQDYQNIQTVDRNWISTIYQVLANILRNDAKEALSLFQQTSQVVVIIYFVGFVLGAFIFWNGVLKLIENERNNWRKMIRIVPNRVILTNNHLKSYLIHNCEGYLDSFKKMLQ